MHQESDTDIFAKLDKKVILADFETIKARYVRVQWKNSPNEANVQTYTSTLKTNGETLYFSDIDICPRVPRHGTRAIILYDCMNS